MMDVTKSSVLVLEIYMEMYNKGLMFRTYNDWQIIKNAQNLLTMN